MGVWCYNFSLSKKKKRTLHWRLSETGWDTLLILLPNLQVRFELTSAANTIRTRLGPLEVENYLGFNSLSDALSSSCFLCLVFHGESVAVINGCTDLMIWCQHILFFFKRKKINQKLYIVLKMKWSILPLDLHTGLSQVPRVCFLVQQGALSPIPAVPSHLCHNSVKLSRAALSFTLDCVFFLSFSDSHLSSQYSTAQNILHSDSLSLSAVFTSFWQLHGSKPSQRNPVADLCFFSLLNVILSQSGGTLFIFSPTSFLCKAPPPPVHFSALQFSEVAFWHYHQ